MKKQIFAVCDTEEEYARNFMDYISRRKNIPFEIRAFTSADSLIAFARKIILNCSLSLRRPCAGRSGIWTSAR